MVKFVVVEDNTGFQKTIINTIEKVMFSTNIEYKIEHYTGYSKSLEKTIKDCSVRKIYVMDIELEGSKSGIDIAHDMRKTDWDSEILFITSHDKMFETVHRTVLKVFDFIEKFHLSDKRLEKNLKLIVNQSHDYEKFCFENKKVKIQIYLKDITHIYRDTYERKLIIQTTNNKFLVNMTINEILKKLDNRFKQIHRACIVNTDRVNSYNWCKGYFILDSGKKIDLCSKLYKENVSE